MPTKPLPEALLSLLEAHSASFGPLYSSDALSDHGPMACLAMHGLGIDEWTIGRFAVGYQKRLATLERPVERLGSDDWHLHVGRADSYPALREFFSGELRTRGLEATLARYLPTLISGWVWDLFHPLIRLAYGIEFGVLSEVAAGLSYLASVGSDAQLGLAARHPAVDAHGRQYLEALHPLRSRALVDGRTSFNQRYRQVVSGTELRPEGGALGVGEGELVRACLEVFHATHDFFALHLVTASHAFAVCAPWVGRHAEGFFSVGLGAAYLAIGAPGFAPVAPTDERLSIHSLTETSDDHDIKLAYACRTLGRKTSDPSYEWVAGRYLESRKALGNREGTVRALASSQERGPLP